MVEGLQKSAPAIKQKSNRVPILKKYSLSVSKPKPEGDVYGIEIGGKSKVGKCQETAWGPKPDQRDAHWISWNTGELAPPGLQTIHAGPDVTSEAKELDRAEKTIKFQTPEPPRSNSALFSRSMSYRNNATSSARTKTRAGYHDQIDATNFRSWHGREPTEYEKEVTYNMMSHLYGGHASKLDKMRRSRSGRYEHPVNFDKRIVRDTFKSLNTIDMSSAPMSAGRKSAFDYYPVSYHNKPKRFESHDCTNTSSFFQVTKPVIRGSFVIHPDFISERTEFSKNLKHSKSTSGNNGTRYGNSLSGV